MDFVNRETELAQLQKWWAKPGPRLGVVWGRRRVGKTALIQHFSKGKRAVFHTGSRRPVADELKIFAAAAGSMIPAVDGVRDWGALFDAAARASMRSPTLLVLDEFPELTATAPDLPSILRAFWDGNARGSKLRILLCGSAVRTMEEMLEERSPLYGRADLSLLVHPFRPHEAALMLPHLNPADRALVWGVTGGVPLYLKWWDQSRSVKDNLAELVCTPGGSLLTEGNFVLSTEGESGELSRQVLHAIAAGRTKYVEIADAVRAEPARTLDRLIELRLVERLVPVTEDPRRTTRRLYQIADNFLAFWLGIVDRHRAEIDRGLGATILPVILQALDLHMGPRWEEAFRMHLRRMASEGALPEGAVAVGRYWNNADPPVELDAVVLAGRSREAVVAGEAKWTRRVKAEPIARNLRRKIEHLPRVRENILLAVAARDHVEGTIDIAVTASDIFS